MLNLVEIERDHSRLVSSRNIGPQYVAESMDGTWDLERAVRLGGENMFYFFTVENMSYVLHYEARWSGATLEYYFGLEDAAPDDIEGIAQTVHAAIVHPHKKIARPYLATSLAVATMVGLSALVTDDVRLSLGAAVLGSYAIEGYRYFNARTDRKNDKSAQKMIEVLEDPRFYAGSEIEYELAKHAPNILAQKE